MHVRVRPGARRTEFAGRFGDHPKIAVAAPPVDGAANEVLVAWLAERLGVRRRDVRIVGGASSRTKRIEVTGLDDGELLTRIRPSEPSSPNEVC